MRLSENIYSSSSIKVRKMKKILRKIRKNENVRGIFLLISRTSNANLIEIVNCNELYRLKAQEEDVCLYAITESKEDAVVWITEAIKSTMEHFYTVNKKNLLMELERNEKDIG